MKHPLHISVTNIETHQKNNITDISIKLFLNDLEQAIGSKFTNNMHTFKNKENTNDFDKKLETYLAENFKLEINMKRVKLSDIMSSKKKQSEEYIWLNYSYVCKTKISSIRLTNTIFTQLFPDQINLVMISIDENQKSFNLNKQNNIAFLKNQ